MMVSMIASSVPKGVCLTRVPPDDCADHGLLRDTSFIVCEIRACRIKQVV